MNKRAENLLGLSVLLSVTVLPLTYCACSEYKRCRANPGLCEAEESDRERNTHYYQAGEWEPISQTADGCTTYRMSGTGGWFHDPVFRTVCPKGKP